MIIDKYKISLCLLFGFLNLAIPISGLAFYGMPYAKTTASGSCTSHGINLIQTDDNRCEPVDSHRSAGGYLYDNTMYYGGPATGRWRGHLQNTYPVTSGQYRMRLSFCATDNLKPGKGCSVATRSSYTTGQPTWLSSSQSIAADDINFGPAPVLQPGVSGTTCVTLVDSREREWKFGDSGMVCSDGLEMASTPAMCTINNGRDLGVALGSLERSRIPTNRDAIYTVKKQVSVSCSRDAKTTLKMQFRYTPINLGGQSFVVTSTRSLGVAIIYNGKVMAPTDTAILNYNGDTTYIDLEFGAVRDWYKNAWDIDTGDFTANAVMIMTEQ